MRHLAVGAWSCMNRIFPPYHFSWNHIWIWTMCRWSRTWLRKYQIWSSLSHTCWREWTVWWDVPKHNNSVFIWGMIVSPPCSSSFCIYLLIGARRMVYSCGVRTKMKNVCYRIEIQSFANPTPWKMGRISLKIYPDSLNFANGCVRKTSPNVLGIFKNRWSCIGIAFARPWCHLVETLIRLWHKKFGHKVVWRL